MEIKSVDGTVIYKSTTAKDLKEMLIEAARGQTNLKKANLPGADLMSLAVKGSLRLILPNANLAGANFSMANLPDVDLSGANLSQANFFGAKLQNANLSGANLAGANLIKADLTGANLTGVTGADLSAAKR